MASVPASVTNALISFFKGDCPGVSPITSSTNVRHLCGYDMDGGEWRGLWAEINTALAPTNYWLLNPMLLDSCNTIADIAGKTTPRAAAGATGAMRGKPTARAKPKARAKSKAGKKAKSGKGKSSTGRKP